MNLTEVRRVIKEMRERKVNHQRGTSPTLNAWADQIEAALKEAPNEKVIGISCTVLWTELVVAMRKDGHAVNDSSGPNTRKVIESVVRDSFAPLPTLAIEDWKDTAVGYRYRVCPPHRRTEAWAGWPGVNAEWGKPMPNNGETVQYQALYTRPAINAEMIDRVCVNGAAREGLSYPRDYTATERKTLRDRVYTLLVDALGED